MNQRSPHGVLKLAPQAAFLLMAAATAGLLAMGPGPDPVAVPVSPGPAPAPDSALSIKALLGRNLFFDPTLSEPIGQSCGSCHEPSAGFTFPESDINREFGVAPGAVTRRFGFRAVPQVSYAALLPEGPPHRDRLVDDSIIGGLFWDGRADNLVDQAQQPFLNANEMNNLTHNLGDPSLVVDKVRRGSNAALFRKVFGPNVFSEPTGSVYLKIAQAISEYERSPQVSPFSSKYDAWKAGVAEFNDDELLGLRLVTGSWSGRPGGGVFPREAHCIACHAIPEKPSMRPDLWSLSPYQNTGVPRNPGNPFYRQTDPVANPVGYNPLGEDFIDYGLGHASYPKLGLPPGNDGPGSDGRGDFLGHNGRFKAPSLRNVDRRPRQDFVKGYMHNGVFKSLEQVVHFYNTRNHTTKPGEIIDFSRDNPYEGLEGTPLWDPPELISSSLENPEGLPGDTPSDSPDGANGAEVGNLGLSDAEEKALVAFLKTLSDGYFDPTQVRGCPRIVSQPVAQRIPMGVLALVTVAATSPASTVTYQWRKDGVPIPGETTSFVQFVFAAAGDAGRYDCVVTSGCGSVTSRAVDVQVCVADFNASGAVDETDREEFLVAYVQNDAAADRNGDGLVNEDDLAVFFDAFENGC